MSRRGAGNRQRNAKDDQAEQARKARCAEVWRLRHVEGKFYSEIADALGISEGTIATDLARARVEPPDVTAYLKAANERLEPVMDVMRDNALRGDSQAANALANLQDKHAKLNGLYAPAKTELSVNGAITPAQARQAMADAFKAPTMTDAGPAPDVQGAPEGAPGK